MTLTNNNQQQMFPSSSSLLLLSHIYNLFSHQAHDSTTLFNIIRVFKSNSQQSEVVLAKFPICTSSWVISSLFLLSLIIFLHIFSLSTFLNWIFLFVYQESLGEGEKLLIVPFVGFLYWSNRLKQQVLKWVVDIFFLFSHRFSRETKRKLMCAASWY